MARVSYVYWTAEPSIRTNRVQRIFVLGQTGAGADADANARHRHRSKPQPKRCRIKFIRTVNNCMGDQLSQYFIYQYIVSLFALLLIGIFVSRFRSSRSRNEYIYINVVCCYKTASLLDNCYLWVVLVGLRLR